MAYNKEASKNLDIYTDVLGMKKESQILYETDKFMVLSPAIQSNPENSRFDVFEKVSNNVLSSNKPGILAVRYFEKILVADIQLFRMHLTRDDCLVYGSKTPKREYAIKNIDGNYFVKLVKAPKEVLLEVFTRNEFIEYLNSLLSDATSENKKFIREDADPIKSIVIDKPLEIIKYISNYISSKGFLYSDSNIKNLYLSIRSKPFVILSGISGTGKTKIIELFAEAVGANQDNGRFKLIPVRPDWSDGSDLTGYTDIKGDFVKGPLTEMVIKATNNPQYPHFVVLDEMNLARVEYYLSDFLSVSESRKEVDGEIVTAPLVKINESEHYGIPENLYIIGTVNMDETTHPFSKKVLDRANSIEFNEVHLTSFSMFAEQLEEMQPIQVTNDLFKSDYLFLKDVYKEHDELVQDVSKELEDINEELKSIYAQVGYRVRDEIVFYMAYNEELGLLERNEAMDFCIMQKILPRISGAGSPVENLLERLFEQFSSKSYSEGMDLDSLAPYPRSSRKLYEMIERLRVQGFVSFWGA